MSDLGKLVPAEVEAPTHSYQRVGVAFGDRFFTLLLVGLVWLVPAFVDLRFVYALLGAYLFGLSRKPESGQGGLVQSKSAQS